MTHVEDNLPILPQCRHLERSDACCGQRKTMIAECAYFRAQRRGFAPGHELEDWLAAEREVDAHMVPAA
ncbi:MAG: DUF2934 domain-containing protein [Burkholderiales bacterium]|nr:DUF2934 domain-containing protein [Burkholderiales bacterium]